MTTTTNEPTGRAACAAHPTTPLSMPPRCVMTLSEMLALAGDLPLKATPDAWHELGRGITDEREAQRIGGLIYVPLWATAPVTPFQPLA